MRFENNLSSYSVEDFTRAFGLLKGGAPGAPAPSRALGGHPGRIPLPVFARRPQNQPVLALYSCLAPPPKYKILARAGAGAPPPPKGAADGGGLPTWSPPPPRGGCLSGPPDGSHWQAWCVSVKRLNQQTPNVHGPLPVADVPDGPGGGGRGASGGGQMPF
ncbi:formin-like protein 20 [Penaeus chinensis]|uniref:formin-like protein 20 n=1 Tax=Penaeus chinensis TaxID=139456 RepID=UPI001FB5D60F|nr:formin-like protein 20 [Penaeus chinensis]